MILVGDELNCRDWIYVDDALGQVKPFWTKRVWMNGKPIWLKAYPLSPMQVWKQVRRQVNEAWRVANPGYTYSE